MAKRPDKSPHPRVSQPAQPSTALPAEPATEVQARITPLVQAAVEGTGLDLIALELRPAGADFRLLLRIDRLAGRGGVKLDDCVTVSRAVGQAMDSDPIAERYELEVSSPGMNRPLRHAADMARFINMTAKLQVKLPNGTQTLTGVLREVTLGDDPTVTIYTGPVRTPKPGAKVSTKPKKLKPGKGLEDLLAVRVADVLAAHLAPTLTEWTMLGQRLAEEARALGEAVENSTLDFSDFDAEWEDDSLDESPVELGHDDEA